MQASEFTKLVETATKRGWAVGQANLQALRLLAKLEGWSEVPQRAGDPPLMELRPLSAEAAPAGSLSAKYGTGAQPLHTDGAHLRLPPDVVILAAVDRSPTPTLLWKGTWEAPVRDGIFVVRSGGTAYLTTAWADGRFRFDPGCMEPADARARAVVDHFEDVRKRRATAHEWTEPGQVLVIDNKQCLHARAAVAPGDEGRVVQRVAFTRTT